MPKYVFLFIDDERLGESHSSTATMDVYQKIGQWWEENSKKGYLKGGEELQPTRTATTIRRQNGKVLVTDGPFLEAKESVGGFAVVEAKDLDDAIALAKTWPGTGIEVRPCVEHDEQPQHSEQGAQPQHA